MSRIRELAKFVQDYSLVFRKGEIVAEHDTGNVHVVTVDAFPEIPSSERTIDMHFVAVGFTADALGRRDEFLELIRESEQGEFASISLDRIKQGPSYIEYGGWLGDQTLALQFLALGELYDLWKVITPERFSVTGDDADRMAGAGFVMNSGLRLEDVS